MSAANYTGRSAGSPLLGSLGKVNSAKVRDSSPAKSDPVKPEEHSRKEQSGEKKSRGPDIVRTGQIAGCAFGDILRMRERTVDALSALLGIVA